MFGFLALLCLVLYVCTYWKRLGIKVDKDAGVKSFCILNSWMSLWFSLLSFNFDNPVSLYNSLKGVNFVPPDIILIASIWTFSKILIKYILWGSHTTSTYSNSGLIKDKYNFSSDNLFSLNFNMRRIFNLEYALSMTSSICLFHEPSSEIVTPRCLWYFTSSSCWLFIIRDGWCGLLTFREITIVSVFWGLKLTNDLQNITQNMKDRATQTPLKTEVNSGTPER